MLCSGRNSKESCLASEVDPGRVIVTSGAQTALSALLDHLAAPGETIIAEAFAYPGLLATAARRGGSELDLSKKGYGLCMRACVRACMCGWVRVFVRA